MSIILAVLLTLEALCVIVLLGCALAEIRNGIVYRTRIFCITSTQYPYAQLPEYEEILNMRKWFITGNIGVVGHKSSF